MFTLIYLVYYICMSVVVVFQLDVQCPQSHAETDKTEVVYSSQLHWVAQGNQEERFPEGVECVEGNITVAMLKAGQRIALEAHARKGIGKDHTKFSPVATASYRLLPDIRFPTPITGDRAQQLVSMCPMNVFDIEDIRGTTTAVVSRPRDCTMCRECIRTEEWTESVTLLRKADHFIFSVESTGVMSPESIIFKGIEVLKEKAITFFDHAHAYAVREGLV